MRARRYRIVLQHRNGTRLTMNRSLSWCALLAELRYELRREGNVWRPIEVIEV